VPLTENLQYRTDNLLQLIRDKAATWVSEHSVQKTSVVAFMSKNWAKLKLLMKLTFCKL